MAVARERQRATDAMQTALSTRFLANQRLTTVWLDRIWNAGIPEVEIFCARQHLDYREPAQLRELAYWFRDSALAVHALHAPLYSDDCWGRTGPHAAISLTETVKSRRVEMVDEIKRAIDVGEYIPFRYLIQHLGAPGEEFDLRKMDAAFIALEELSVFAHQRGVELLLKNTADGLSTASRLLHFLEVTHLRLGLCFDAGAAHRTGNLEAEFQLMKSRIRSTHLHDNDGDQDLHLLPGASGGTIDWKRLVALLRSLEEPPPLVLELLEPPDGPRPLAAIRAALDRLLSLP